MRVIIHISYTVYDVFLHHVSHLEVNFELLRLFCATRYEFEWRQREEQLKTEHVKDRIKREEETDKKREKEWRKREEEVGIQIFAL
jgi:hypothetical protein